MPPPSPPTKRTHPAATARQRTPGPKTGVATVDPKDAGPVGKKPAKAPPISPLLTAGVVTITPDILGEIVPTKGLDATKVSQNLNATISAAKVTTALAEAMFIAQLIVESGSFTKETVTEGGVNNPEVYNPRPGIGLAFKQTFSGKNDLQRYLHNDKKHHDQVEKWRASQALYAKTKAAFAKTSPGKDFDASGTWKPAVLTDYLPGDVEVVRWKLWYDVESPFARRAKLAKDMENTKPGDGLRFIGRGYIQLTWRTNYLRAGKAVGLDLDKQPDLAAKPDNSIKISAWFWSKTGCNRKANADTDEAFVNVSKAINGAKDKAGVIGMKARETAYAKVKAALLKQIPDPPKTP